MNTGLVSMAVMSGMYSIDRMKGLDPKGELNLAKIYLD